MITQARGNIGDGADSRVVEASLETNGPQRCQSVLDADPKADIVAKPAPLLGQGTDSITHFERHEDGLVLRIFHWNWIIEDHHHTIAGIALERATVLDNDLADCGVIVSQQSHHVCCDPHFR